MCRLDIRVSLAKRKGLFFSATEAHFGNDSMPGCVTETNLSKCDLNYIILTFYGVSMMTTNIDYFYFLKNTYFHK